MNDLNKRKRIHLKVVCMECGTQFNDDFNKKLKAKLHRGKWINVKHIGAPKNPFESAAKTLHLNRRAMILVSRNIFRII